MNKIGRGGAEMMQTSLRGDTTMSKRKEKGVFLKITEIRLKI
jgi:hypothetical protein